MGQPRPLATRRGGATHRSIGADRSLRHSDLQAKNLTFPLEPELVDHIDPLAVPMVSEMPSLDGLSDDVGPERGDAFAAGIARRGINNPVISRIAMLACESL